MALRLYVRLQRSSSPALATSGRQSEGAAIAPGQGKRDGEKEVSQQHYLYQGIAGRSFERRFQLAENVEVRGAQLDSQPRPVAGRQLGGVQLELVAEAVGLVQDAPALRAVERPGVAPGVAERGQRPEALSRRATPSRSPGSDSKPTPAPSWPPSSLDFS